jgi:O-antigen/teichoic acid export membrane protein
VNVSSHQLIHLFFNTIFNSTIAGYYYLSQRLLGVPVSIIASSVTSVFQEKATKDFKKHGNAKVIFLNTFIKLFFIIAIPVMFFYFYAIDIFVFIFGENWKEAGIYAQILSPVLFLQFISGPLSVMFYIGEKQELNLYLQLLLAILVISSFILASTSYNVILSLSFSFSLFYLIQLILSFKIAGFFNNFNYFFRRS